MFPIGRDNSIIEVKLHRYMPYLYAFMYRNIYTIVILCI